MYRRRRSSLALSAPDHPVSMMMTIPLLMTFALPTPALEFQRRTLFASSAALLPAIHPRAATAAPAPLEIVPLSLCGGAYCVPFTIDGQPFRAVVDTGSPFILVDGLCSAADTATASKAGATPKCIALLLIVSEYCLLALHLIVSEYCTFNSFLLRSARNRLGMLSRQRQAIGPARHR